MVLIPRRNPIISRNFPETREDSAIPPIVFRNSPVETSRTRETPNGPE